MIIIHELSTRLNSQLAYCAVFIKRHDSSTKCNATYILMLHIIIRI